MKFVLFLGVVVSTFAYATPPAGLLRTAKIKVTLQRTKFSRPTPADVPYIEQEDVCSGTIEVEIFDRIDRPWAPAHTLKCSATFKGQQGEIQFVAQGAQVREKFFSDESPVDMVHVMMDQEFVVGGQPVDGGGSGADVTGRARSGLSLMGTTSIGEPAMKCATSPCKILRDEIITAKYEFLD